MVIGILNFGEGLLWFHYLLFCVVASLGALQLAAAHARLIGLMFLPVPVSRWLGAILVVGAFAWFFTIQPDLFIPGLAGGEFFTLFLLGFVSALVAALGLSVVAQRVLSRAAWSSLPQRERIRLGAGQSGELVLPARNAPPVEAGAQAPPSSPLPLVIALREADVDSLEVLSRRLVASGAAVLLCGESAAGAALEFAERNGERFHPQHRFVMGVGRGADRALQLAAAGKIHAALALAPFGFKTDIPAGLRWLCEADYLTAWRLTRKSVRTAPDGLVELNAAPANALVVYGDEDMLVPPAEARKMYPSAVMVAGARHFTLAALPATLQLAGELFDLHRPAPGAIRRLRRVAPPAPGELGE